MKRDCVLVIVNQLVVAFPLHFAILKELNALKRDGVEKTQEWWNGWNQELLCLDLPLALNCSWRRSVISRITQNPIIDTARVVPFYYHQYGLHILKRRYSSVCNKLNAVLPKFTWRKKKNNVFSVMLIVNCYALC